MNNEEIILDTKINVDKSEIEESIELLDTMADKMQDIEDMKSKIIVRNNENVYITIYNK